LIEKLFVERMSGNEKIFEKLMNDKEFKEYAADHLAGVVYNSITASMI